MLSVTQTLPSHWKYVSEGGATIVFSYVGPPDTGFEGTVLRLRKALVPVPLATQENNEALRAPGAGASSTNATDNEPDDPTIEYQVKCMSRLIPLDHLPRLETVALDEPWLNKLVAIQNLERPEVRREKDGIDLDRKKGVLATDLVGGNWLAAEIKVGTPQSVSFQLKS
jgi:inositol-pentakisphosphate 2-kinase